MSAWWSGTLASFLATDPAAIADRLAHEAARRHRTNELQQLRAWQVELATLRATATTLIDHCRDGESFRLLFEYGVDRIGTRADAVLVTPYVVLVLEFKVGAARHAPDARRQVHEYALDLQDFHAASRRHPIVPVLVATHADAGAAPTRLPLLIAGAASVVDTSAEGLPGLVVALASGSPRTRHAIDPAHWEHAHYAPVPGIIDAARTLFGKHDVAEITHARADATNLTRTTAAIDALLAETASRSGRIVIFVTGIPGAGKTLCGLATAFGAGRHGDVAFLTGNPTLVHVLREALARDARDNGMQINAARQRMQAIIQALPRFRDAYVGNGHPPAERIVVIDEAQRSWTEAQAVAKTRDRPVPLTASEPAHLLDIMARRDGFAAMVCLVGNGQEIHVGEGGLAEWSEALAARPDWQVTAAETVLEHPAPRSRLQRLPSLRLEPSLHLDTDLRALRHDDAALWVDALLRGDAARARDVAGADGELPFRLCRSLDAMRAGLRAACRGHHRAGLVASSGARRLRAEGLGAELPHMEADPVSRWFLDSWLRRPDPRASDALEVVATEFSIQGLELDHVGLAWDGDMVRAAGRPEWVVRRFVGREWQVTRRPDRIEFGLNTYRVLLSRARYRTIIWVPRGDPDDPTRPPATYDAIADFLVACGVRPLEIESAPPPAAPATAPLLIG